MARSPAVTSEGFIISLHLAEVARSSTSGDALEMAIAATPTPRNIGVRVVIPELVVPNTGTTVVRDAEGHIVILSRVPLNTS